MATELSPLRLRKFGVACALSILIVANLILLTLGLHSKSFWTSGPVVPNLQPIMSESIGSNTMVSVTVDNHLTEIVQHRVVRSVSVNETINSMAVSPDGSKIYVGTSVGDVLVYNRDLKAQGKMHVQGNISGMAALQNGDVAVTYSQGQYTNLDFIDIFQNGRMVATKQIGVAVTAMAPSTNGVLYGTSDSHVGMLTTSGHILWQTLLNQQIESISQASDGQIYVGDNAGTLYSLSPLGKITWTRSVSHYGIQTVKSINGLILVGDQNGNVLVLNPSGTVLHDESVFTPNAVVPTPVQQTQQSVLLMSDTGQSGDVDLTVAANSNNARSVQEITDAILSGICLLLAAWWTPGIRKFVKLRLRDIRASGPAYALIWPAVVLICVFNVVPIIMALFFSMTNYSLQSPLQFTGISNYISMWSDMFFTVGMWHIGVILLTSVVKELTFPLLVAELVFWLTNEKLKYWFRTAFVLPSVVPGVVGLLLWKQIYSPEAGLINSLLGAIGLKQWENQWLGNPHTALGSIIFAGFPFVDIFAFLVYYGGLIGISKDVFDAGLVDGANWWTRFWKIELPSIKPQIRLIMFFTIVGSIQTFTNVYVYTDGGPGTATSVPALEMYNQISNGFFGLSSGMGVVLALIMLAVTFINFRMNRQEEV